jgi:hypothetical protein
MSRKRGTEACWQLLVLSLMGCEGGIVSTVASDGGSSGSSSGPGSASSGVATGSESGSGGGAASGPKCGAIPTQLVDFNALATTVDSAVISAIPLEVDATNVYFVFSNTLMRVPIRGGSVTTMLRLPTLPHLFVQNVDPIVTSTSVIVHYLDSQSDGTNEQIVSVPIHGGNPTPLATTSGSIVAFGGNEHDIYFIDQGGIKSVPTIGGNVRLLTDRFTSSAIGGFGEGLAVVGSNVIATTSAQGGGVVAVPLQGGSPTALATQQPNASFPMPCGTDICWWSGATPDGVAGTSGPGAIERLHASGGLTSLPEAPYFPWSLVFDGTDFFETVGCDICDGSLVRIPAAGGPSVSMGSGSFVAVDDSCAYWSTLAGISSASKAYVAPAAP